MEKARKWEVKDKVRTVAATPISGNLCSHGSLQQGRWEVPICPGVGSWALPLFGLAWHLPPGGQQQSWSWVVPKEVGVYLWDEYPLWTSGLPEHWEAQLNGCVGLYQDCSC